MLKSSILDIMRTFTKEDLAKFEDFVKSPYHNKKSNVVKLFMALKKFHPAFDDGKLGKEDLWKKMYPGKPYNYGIMKNLIFDLAKLGECYLSIHNTMTSINYEKNLLNELKERDIKQLLNKRIHLFEKKVNSVKIKDQNYFEDMAFIRQFTTYLNIDKILSDKLSIDSIEIIIKHFLFAFLDSSFQAMAIGNQAKKKEDFEFLEIIIDYFKDKMSLYTETPILQIYFYATAAILNPEDEFYFMEARRIFNKNFFLMDSIDKRSTYNALTAICMQKGALGRDKYWKILLEINMEMLDKENFNHNGSSVMNLLEYRNIIALTGKLGEKILLKDFITKYKDKVEPEYRNEIEIYSKANLLYLEGMFADCLSVCSKIDFMNFFKSVSDTYYYKNDIKVMMLKCFYDLDMIENVITAIDSHKHFLANSTAIGEGNKNQAKNFIFAAAELIKLRLKPNKKNLQDYKDSIINLNPIISKNWLLEKIDIIMKENKYVTTA